MLIYMCLLPCPGPRQVGLALVGLYIAQLLVPWKRLSKFGKPQQACMQGLRWVVDTARVVAM